MSFRFPIQSCIVTAAGVDFAEEQTQYFYVVEGEGQEQSVLMDVGDGLKQWDGTVSDLLDADMLRRAALYL